MSPEIFWYLKPDIFGRVYPKPARYPPDFLKIKTRNPPEPEKSYTGYTVTVYEFTIFGHYR